MHFGIGAVGFFYVTGKTNSADAKMHPDRGPLTTARGMKWQNWHYG